MKTSFYHRISLVSIMIITLFLYGGADCGGKSAVGGNTTGFSYNIAITTMGGTYTKPVLEIHYFVSMTTIFPGTHLVPEGLGDIYTIVDYSTDGGVHYSLCHNVQDISGDDFTFTEMPLTKESIFQWGCANDLGGNADIDSCMIRIRAFRMGDNPLVQAPRDIETSEEFSISLGMSNICGDPPEITSGQPPDGTDNELYSFQFTISGGYGNITWFLGTPIDEDVVTGLTLTSTGLLSGTPHIVGDPQASVEITLDVWVIDSCIVVPRTDNKVYTIRINPEECGPGPEITTTTLPLGTQGEPYDYQIPVTDGEGNLTWIIEQGTLPDGLQLSDTGRLVGTPTENGVFYFTIRVTDSCWTEPQYDDKTFMLAILPP